MKERIEEKIGAIIDRIINKPTEEITLDDYTILSSELRDIRFREEKAETDAKFASLMASNLSAFNSCGFGSAK